MSVSITVRNVSADVRDELAARAARAGQSLQEYLSAQLRRLATTPTADDAIMRARQNVRSYPDVTMDEIVQVVHAERR